jgi:rhodanese-related sulfurtransferase
MVAAIGALLAFVANAVSPRGLTLSRDYFPGAVRSRFPGAANTNLLLAAAATNAQAAAQLVAARLQAKNLRMVDREQAQLIYLDPRYQHGVVVFVDARDDEHYRAGHVPGAHQFDHYRAPNYLAAILPVCTAAEHIVVYCNGGDCEDSEFAAVTLRELGVPNEKLFIYGGGFTDWATNGLPVELGMRGSGTLREATK